MNQKYPIPVKVRNDSSSQEPQEPIRKVLVIGHGDLANRQRPTYEHWLNEGVEVHCADVYSVQLDDCLEGIHRYVLPGEKHKLAALGPDHFDLLCVNNVPELHIATALEYNTLARQIIIQKPQDLNFPLIRTMAEARGYEDFRNKAKIHDHYRNKGVVPALLKVLADLHTDYGQFRRLLFFLTESKSVNDEVERAASLKCGMIQDLGVHMLSLLLDCIPVGVEWEDERGSDRLHRRLGGEIEVVHCPKLRVQNSILGDHVETFAAIDLRICERIEFPAGTQWAKERLHTFDVLIVVGKGLAIEQGISRDLKVIVAEYERNGYEAMVDLMAQGIQGIQDYLPEGGQEINKHHGGLNRPLLLISPNPPEHALRGLGGLDYQQWQDFSFAQHIASNVEIAQKLESPVYMQAYPPQRPLGDLVRGLATEGQIRPTWGNLEPLTRYSSIAISRSEDYYA
jgi:hypothetical protein